MLIGAGLLGWAGTGCSSPSTRLADAVAPAASEAGEPPGDVGVIVAAQIPTPAEPPVPRPLPTTRPVTIREIDTRLPDLQDWRAVWRDRLEEFRGDQQFRAYQEIRDKNLRYIDQTRRGRRVRLRLADVIARALANNYGLRVESYNPAISVTQIVEAEAIFDAVFFATYNENIQDRPSATPELSGTNQKSRSFEGGIRKLLPVGTAVSTSYLWTRAETDLSFQTINPSYFNDFVVELRQPLLRGFGLDFNRSQIHLRKNEHRAALLRYRQNIRETLLDLEQAYWQVLQARREVGIAAELLALTEQTYQYVSDRKGFDAYPVLVANAKSRFETRKADYVRVKTSLRDAEDQLKVLMNDSALNMADDVELVPSDLPAIELLATDPLAEAQTALNHRSELAEARLQIENARIAVMAARNQALPRLDVLFRYQVDGLGDSSHDAFSQLSENDYHEYVIAVELEWPIGNRGPRAALRRAKLQQLQACAALKAGIEQILAEVNVAVRDLRASYEQIAPNLEAVRAATENVVALQARRERLSPPQLETELASQEQLAAAKRQLLQSLINYNVAIVNLERAKGTLLNYNNVALADAP